ncbi:MAG: PAC2 family protein [Phycisphaerales bacterium]|nr:PAC2 family protein [Phycisphaerales bacterium]
MSPEVLKIHATPKLSGGTLLLALTGWMDGGFVSTGTVKQLMEGRQLTRVADIQPGGFYIDSFPGSMETTALFRPHAKYVNGLVESLDLPGSSLWADESANMAFMAGREPNINWPLFAEAILEVVARLEIKRIIFMGSFGGSVPHTREPRLYASVSSKLLLPLLTEYGLRPSQYEGPGSFSSYLLVLCPDRNIEMLAIAAEIPGYLEGINPRSIETITRKLAGMLNLRVDVDKLRQESNHWELQVSEAVDKNEDMAATVRKLEQAYDTALVEEGEVSSSDQN